MTYISIVKGKIIETTGGNYNTYAEEDIITSSAKSITEVGVEKGVLYANNPGRIKREPQKVLLHLLFFIDEDHKGRNMIKEAAQTRLQNIKANKWFDDKIYKAFCIPIQSVDEIITQIAAIIKKHGGKEIAIVQEISVFSHAGGDGPISYNKNVTNSPVDPENPNQMAMAGWAQIKVTWSAKPIFVFYGCNTASTVYPKNFAKEISNLSNFANVEIWGQPTSSFPSFEPDGRITSIARNMDTGWNVGIRAYTYMVAGNPKEGFNATISKIKSHKMNCYKNGNLVRTEHQSYFNDHR